MILNLFVRLRRGHPRRQRKGDPGDQRVRGGGGGGGGGVRRPPPSDRVTGYSVVKPVAAVVRWSAAAVPLRRSPNKGHYLRRFSDLRAAVAAVAEKANLDRHGGGGGLPEAKSPLEGEPGGQCPIRALFSYFS